jgi:DNA-binding transcriptional LysR family regulator
MLNPYHLKYFYDACQNESLVKSAEINRISHSAVSQAIKSLENILDTKLLHHAKRKFSLTAPGELLFKESVNLFNSLERVVHSVKNVDPLAGTLRIGVSHSLSNVVVDKIRSNIDCKIFIGNSSSLEALLLSRQIDIGFGIDDGSFVAFDRQFIKSGKFVLAGIKHCKYQDRFLMGDKGSEVASLRIALKKKLPEARFSEIQSWSVISKLAEEGMGIGLLPDFFLENKNAKLVRVHKDIKLPSYDLHAFFRNAESLSNLAKSFLSEFKQ